MFESEAFKALYDPEGHEERKVRLGRRQLQVFNQLNADSSLFQKVYYHPGLLQEDEQKLRTIFWKHSQAHDQMQTWAGVGTFAAFWPIMYNLSKTMKPAGCLVFTAAYYFGWTNVTKPFLSSRL